MTNGKVTMTGMRGEKVADEKVADLKKKKEVR